MRQYNFQSKLNSYHVSELSTALCTSERLMHNLKNFFMKTEKNCRKAKKLYGLSLMETVNATLICGCGYIVMFAFSIVEAL